MPDLYIYFVSVFLKLQPMPVVVTSMPVVVTSLK